MTDTPVSGVAFAEMTPADLDEARDLWRRTPGIGLYEADDSVAALTAYLARNPGFSRVARAGGVLIGAVLCGHDGRRGAVYHLAVKAGCRGRGVGRQLLEQCLDRLAAVGIRRCNLFVLKTNTEAAGFYDRLRWRERVDLRMLSKDLL